MYFPKKERLHLICGSLEKTSIVALCACTHLFTSLKCLCVALATVPTISPSLSCLQTFNSFGLCYINNSGKKETELLQGWTPDCEWYVSQSVRNGQKTDYKRKNGRNICGVWLPQSLGCISNTCVAITPPRSPIAFCLSREL